MPERKYTPEDIVEAAFRVVRARGWDACTARAIAKELGASTMPIYSALDSMKGLEEEIRRRASDLLIEYQTRDWTEHGFLNMGVGYVRFAQEERQLFRMMYLREQDETAGDGGRSARGEYVMDTLMKRLAHEPVMEGLTGKQRRDVLYKMWVFSHGLAILINNAVIGPMDAKKITRFLMDTGWLIISGEKQKSREARR